MAAHTHSRNGLTFSASNHRHGIIVRTGSDIGNTFSPRASNNSGTVLTFSTRTYRQSHTISGTIGSGSSADSGLTTSSTTPSSGLPSNNTTGGPSTNQTGEAIGSTNGPSVNLTSTFSENTDSGGGSITTSSSNPPYLTVNFVIQAL
jgi:hypothetical protein